MNMPGFFPPNQQQQHPMAVTSLLDTSLPETILSEEKSQAIVDLIKERFNETDHAPVGKQKEALFEGDRSEDSHMMSRKMMQTYIGSYWYHFSEQFPICKYSRTRYHEDTFAKFDSAQTDILPRQNSQSLADSNDGHWSIVS